MRTPRSFSALAASVLIVGTMALAACASEGDAPVDDADVSAGDDKPADLAKVIEGNLDPETAAESKDTGADDVNADRDQDGIPDAVEEQLLRQYRPYYKFTKEGDKVEANRPADPITELENAQLKQMTGDTGVTDPIAGCGRASDKHLVPAASVLTCKPETSFVKTKAVSTYCLNIADNRFGGVSLTEAKAKGTGFFGHVAKDTVNGHDAYKIEYWQFFAFNNQDISVLGLGSFGDHEGDWTSVQAWYDLTTKDITKLQYLIHGKQLTFNIPASAAKATCKECFNTVKGPHWNLNVASFFDAAERPKYNDNQAEFYITADGKKHVVLYVERGGHESWPGAWGHADIQAGPATIHDNAHTGGGLEYLVPDIKDRPFNLGELDHPLTANARTMLAFNGHWGCTNSKDVFGLGPERRSPVGPAMHCEWKWPHGEASAKGCEH